MKKRTLLLLTLCIVMLSSQVFADDFVKITLNMTSSDAPSPFNTSESSYSASYRCWKMFDGIRNSSGGDNYWQTAAGGNCWLDLGANGSARISKFAVDYYNSVNYAPFNIDVRCGNSTDGNDYLIYFGTPGHNPSSQGAEDYFLTTNNTQSCRYVNITEATCSGGACLIEEFTFYKNTTSGSPAPSITINLPLNNTAAFSSNSSFRLNTTTINWGGSNFNTTQYVYFENGSLFWSLSNASANLTNNITLNYTGRYYVNATASNGTYQLNSSTYIFTLYNLTKVSFVSPGVNETVSGVLLINFTNATTTNDSVAISFYNITLRNSDLSYNSTIRTNNGLNNTYSWDSLTSNLTIGQYYVMVEATDVAGYKINTTQLIYVATNSRINITARTYFGNASISNFTGWAYRAEDGTNVSFNTTSAEVILGAMRGNFTIYVEAEGYAISNATNTVTVNVNVSTYNLTMYLYLTNTLNISFYNQATNSLINGSLLQLDLISTLYSHNYSTTNGTLFLTVLQPENYTIRYRGTGFDTRYYYLELQDQSYTNLLLYLLNSSTTYNVTFTIIDESTSPVVSAHVKALKYDIVTNSYILQEIGVTDSLGKTILHLTYNDEFYKIMIEYNGVLYLTTAPAYITTDAYTFQIILTGTTGSGYYDYLALTKNVSFIDATDSFRLTYDDPSGESNQVCMNVVRIGGGIVNSSCTTSSSLTMTLGVTPTAGYTYTASAFRYVSGVKEFLDSESHTYAKSVNMGRFGLFIQFLISALVACLVIVDVSLGLVAVPSSLLIGYWFGLHQLSLVSIIVMIAVMIIVAYVVRRVSQ